MKIILSSPLDMHLHLREEGMLQAVAPLTTASFAGAVIMPNLISPVDSLAKVQRYKEQIDAAGKSDSFVAYMTLFFKKYSRAELIAAKNEIIGIKLYPAGITTRSENGVTDFNDIDETLQLMEEMKIPLLVHQFPLHEQSLFFHGCQYLAQGVNQVQAQQEFHLFVDLEGREITMSKIPGCGQYMADTGHDPLGAFRGKAKAQGNFICRKKTNPVKINRQAIGVLIHNGNGIVPVFLINPDRKQGGNPMGLQKHHHFPDGTVLGPGC